MNTDDSCMHTYTHKKTQHTHTTKTHRDRHTTSTHTHAHTYKSIAEMKGGFTIHLEHQVLA